MGNNFNTVRFWNIPDIDLDVDNRTITVGDFIYSFDILADGLQTPPGVVAMITPGQPGPDGKRQVIISTRPSRDREDVAPPPYWLVWREGGEAPTYRHPDEDSATTEAERLSKLNPGKPFVVLCPVSRITAESLKVENFDPTDDGIPF
jgi:hypothetical protein